MGKPAARLGDMTVHGGSIVVGCPTVLIGGMPAARLGDMTVCPMVTPAPAPIPHVGGPISLGSTGVLIGGMPAARMGDMCVCVGPPSSIALGCMTVLIGEVGGGGGGGGGGGAGGAGGGSVSAGSAARLSAAAAGKDEHTDEEAAHALKAEFVDKAGLPICGVNYTIKGPDGASAAGTLTGPIEKRGVKQGTYEIGLNAIAGIRWSATEANVGEKVKLTVETAGLPSGTPAVLIIYICDSGFADRPLTTIQANVSGDRIEAEWALQVDEAYLKIHEAKAGRGRYSQPCFHFAVYAGSLTARSGLLRYKDWVKLQLKDNDGTAIANTKFTAALPTGEIRHGTLDSSGTAKIDGVPPGKLNVKFNMK